MRAASCTANRAADRQDVRDAGHASLCFRDGGVGLLDEIGQLVLHVRPCGHQLADARLQLRVAVLFRCDLRPVVAVVVGIPGLAVDESQLRGRESQGIVAHVPLFVLVLYGAACKSDLGCTVASWQLACA